FAMSTQQDINAIRAQRLANTYDPLALMAKTQTLFHPDQSSLIPYLQHPQPNKNIVLQPSFNMNYMQQPIQNPEDILDLTTFRPNVRQIARIQNGYNAMQNVENQVVLNAVQNPVIQNVGNQNGLSVDLGIENQYGIGNVVTARAEGNDNGINGNQMRCYNCRGLDHYARNCTVKPRKREAAYFQTQVHIAQKEEAGIQLNSKEFDFMAAAGSYHEIKEVTVNCTLKDNLQQASTSGTQTGNASVYDSNGPAENDSNVISVVSSMEQSGGIVEQNTATVEETWVFVSQKAKSREELYFSNISKAARVSKSISILNKEFLDDTTPSVARKFLNEISYDKAYNDMQQKIKWLQAQLGDLKGKSKDTPCESDTLDPLSRKLENENVELKFQDTTKGTSTNTKFANQSNERKPSLQSLRNNFVVRQPNAFQSKRLKFSKTRVPPKVDESNDLSNPVTSNSTLPLENQQL
ncbi:retrovirus-related pol polyprotein from transposon TNT 1-94, partial [Tanacetum coccineum]